jgi:hypothetical protein
VAYTPQTWADGESGQTPITATRLTAIETGIQAAAATADTAAATAATKVDPTSLPEAVQDIVGTMIVAGTNVTKVYDDNAGTVTISATASGGSTVSDATTGTKGIIQLAGDLAGTAAAPTVPGLAGKVDTTDPRLSDARTPTAHTHTAAQISNSTATGQSLVTAADAAAARTTLGAPLGTGVTEIRVLTAAAYAALGTKNATTLYFVVG